MRCTAAINVGALHGVLSGFQQGDVQLQWNGSLYIVQRVMNSDDKSTSKGGGYSPSFFLLIYIYIISHTAKVDKYNPRLKRG
ncbi:hypothetical protein DJ44_5846 (plasmid) [Bacillus anthracis]|nr:hypothetical protein DJ44_5846 [Bacillus anthracis]AJG45509.1 hypothetical protein AS53_5898 [Bacillus anthracis str. Turkey32]AJH31848.1 hypothetical protein BF26_5586 [Bacillus anthracis]AJH37331.1 hypothetical protein BF90_5824 [Bacillus anthracis]KFJ83889.1 hypothetical protein DJ42_5390 [Bacillus anthracis]